MSRAVEPGLVHETAIVEPGAVLGEGARVWHHAHVMAGARVGARSSLGKGVFVAGRAVIGAGVRVQNGVSVFDGVTLEDDVFVGPHAVFTNVKAPRAFVSRKSELAETRVERGATIGAGAVIVCGVTVGAYAFVGAGAVVTRSVPAHALVVGNPARRVGWVSRLGRRLSAAFVCPESGERYREEGEGLVRDEGGVEEASGAVKKAGAAEEARPVVAKTAAAPRVPFQDLAAEHAPLAAELRAALDRALDTGRFVLGDEVARLEAALAERLGVAHAVGVSSGTDALLATLMALGIGAGDEVITTPFTFFATAGAIARAGATPVFVDVEAEGLCVDAAAVRAAVTSRTRAIMPVHLYGRAASPAVFDVGAELGLPVIEDAAQALGGVTERGAVGALGTAGCFSFFPTKNLGALGDGGLVVTNDHHLAERVRLLRGQGARAKYRHVTIGGNFRLDALQAAFLSVKLPHLDAWTEARRAHAAAYEAAFAGLAGLTTPGLVAGHVYHQYVVRHPERDRLRAGLAERGVDTEVYYPEPLHLAQAFAPLGYEVGSLPVAERAAREVLALPVFPALGEERRARVIAAVREVLG